MMKSNPFLVNISSLSIRILSFTAVKSKVWGLQHTRKEQYIFHVIICKNENRCTGAFKMYRCSLLTIFTQVQEEFFFCSLHFESGGVGVGVLMIKHKLKMFCVGISWKLITMKMGRGVILYAGKYSKHNAKIQCT